MYLIYTLRNVIRLAILLKVVAGWSIPKFTLSRLPNPQDAVELAPQLWFSIRHIYCPVDPQCHDNMVLHVRVLRAFLPQLGSLPGGFQGMLE